MPGNVPQPALAAPKVYATPGRPQPAPPRRPSPATTSGGGACKAGWRSHRNVWQQPTPRSAVGNRCYREAHLGRSRGNLVTGPANRNEQGRPNHGQLPPSPAAPPKGSGRCQWAGGGRSSGHSRSVPSHARTAAARRRSMAASAWRSESAGASAALRTAAAGAPAVARQSDQRGTRPPRPTGRPRQRRCRRRPEPPPRTARRVRNAALTHHKWRQSPRWGAASQRGVPAGADACTPAGTGPPA